MMSRPSVFSFIFLGFMESRGLWDPAPPLSAPKLRLDDFGALCLLLSDLGRDEKTKKEPEDKQRKTKR